MTPKTLRVRARGPRENESGPPMVQNYDRLEAGVNAFVGMKLLELEDKPGQFGFVVQDEIVELPYRSEYVKALKDGDLLPADDETAKLAGLQPTNTMTPPDFRKDDAK
jgi:hypothetical protein